MARVVDGKRLAERLKQETAECGSALGHRGVRVGLDSVMVGDPAAGEIYTRSQKRSCEEVGIAHRLHALPPAVNPMVVGVGSPWLPPVHFGLKRYLDLCRSLDQALSDLEARFPSHRRLLTIEARNKRLKRRPK